MTITLGKHYEVPPDFGINKLLEKFDERDVVVLHNNYKCALIFHSCIPAQEGKQKEGCASTVDVYYKNIKDRAKLLGGWLDAMEKNQAVECGCKVEGALREFWKNQTNIKKA